MDQKTKSMRKYLIAILLSALLFTTSGIQAQKHRHHPQVVNVTSTPDTAGIEAYSDTTSIDTAGTVVTVPHGTNWDDDGFYVDHISLNDVKDLLGLGVGGTLIGIAVLLLFGVIVLAPFLLIIFIIYQIFKNRRQRYQLAEKAMESGQQIPEELVRTGRQSDEFLWKKGIKNIFVGIGIAVMCYCLGANPMAGIGWLVAFYGLGQAVIAKTSTSKRDKYDDPTGFGHDSHRSADIP
jgi:hypothetical protein